MNNPKENKKTAEEKCNSDELKNRVAVVDMPVDKWLFALEVNLTGYFLMARAAARIMIKQSSGGVIINISSKSCLEVSSSAS